jgi:phenylacetic acid degradation operon negative regulatory protein
VLTDDVATSERARLRDDLAWGGYGAFASGLYARPSAADAGRADGAIAWPRGVLRFAGRDLPGVDGATLAARVDDAWALPQRAVEYQGFIGRFQPLAAAFDAPQDISPEQAFCVRTLLVHEYRRVRLRDPQLPPDLLPPAWPGAAAYALARTLYRAAEPLAREHLAAALDDEGEDLLPALPEFLLRFQPG